MPERWKPSVTVAAIIERRDGDTSRFLLVEEHTPEGLKLNNPAGHLDPEESPQQGVIREVLEETACVFTPDRLVGVYLSRFQRPATGEDVTFVRFAFGGSVGAPDPARTLDDGIVRTLWMTLPELSEKRIHRYDLLKAKMEQSDAIDDVRSAVTRTLQSGNRVWLVGGAQLSPEEAAFVLSPAPDPKFGWDSGMYDYAWSTQLGKFLQQHVIDGEVVLSPMSGVNSNENIPLLIARGWRD